MRQRLEFLLTEMAQGTVKAAHDVVEGGLAVALAEMVEGVGAVVSLEAENPLLALFGEGLGRIVVAVEHGHSSAFPRAGGAAGSADADHRPDRRPGPYDSGGRDPLSGQHLPVSSSARGLSRLTLIPGRREHAYEYQTA